MVSFAFDLLESEIDDLDGRSLGHVTVSTDAGTATSTPAMMVFLSLPLLLDGLRRFLGASEGSFRFTGVGSSYSILFTRDGDGRLELASGGRDLGSWQVGEVVVAVRQGARDFVATYLDALSLSDMAYDDLETAVEEFEAAFPDLVP